MLLKERLICNVTTSQIYSDLTIAMFVFEVWMTPLYHTHDANTHSNAILCVFECVYVYKYIWKQVHCRGFFCEKQAHFIMQSEEGCSFDQWLNKLHQETHLWLIVFSKIKSWHTSKVIKVTSINNCPFPTCSTVIISLKSNKTCSVVESVGLGSAKSCLTIKSCTLKSLSCYIIFNFHYFAGMLVCDAHFL